MSDSAMAIRVDPTRTVAPAGPTGRAAFRSSRSLVGSSSRGLETHPTRLKLKAPRNRSKGQAPNLLDQIDWTPLYCYHFIHKQ